MSTIAIAGSEDIVPEKLGTPAKEVWKPDVSSFPDAVVDGKLVVPIGKDIVIEYPEPWRETALMKIMAIFDETYPTESVVIETTDKAGNVSRRTRTSVRGTTCDVGYVRLLDMQKNHFASTNYLTAKNHGLVLKVWTGKLPPQ